MHSNFRFWGCVSYVRIFNGVIGKSKCCGLVYEEILNIEWFTCLAFSFCDVCIQGAVNVKTTKFVYSVECSNLSSVGKLLYLALGEFNQYGISFFQSWFCRL